MEKPRHAFYFEGILQLRSPSQEILDYVMKVAEHASKPFYTQLKKVRNGYDLYFLSQRFLQQFGKRLQEKFGGEMKVSAHIHTRSRITSKDVYRINVLIRTPFYKVGDIIEFKGDLYKVLKMIKKVDLENLNTHKKLTVRYKDLPE